MADIVTAETTAFWQKSCTITGGNKWCSCCYCAFVKKHAHRSEFVPYRAGVNANCLRTLTRRVPIVTLVDFDELNQ